MPMTVWPSDAMNSFGAYVASAATVSDPCDLMEAGTWAAIELTALDGTVDGVEPDPEPLLQALEATVLQTHADPETFRRQSRDLYVPAGDSGFWQGAIRDTNDASYGPLIEAKHNKGRIMVDLLYGDYEGGQRTIARFTVNTVEDRDLEPYQRDASVVRYWNVDGDDPRHA